MNIYAQALMLWLIMDSVGNIPVFAAILNHIPAEKRKKIILRESLIALLVLFIFLFFGSLILNSMQLSHAALSISGAIILFLIAIKMIFPSPASKEQSFLADPFIVPLAIPLTAGPASMTMVMLLHTQYPNQIWASCAVILIAWFFTALFLYFGESLSRILGTRGLIAIERLMGMLLTTLAVQMLLNGVSLYIHT
ncbi:MAG: MarC family protein [Gammaproteobacteria bacterium]|nr:MarC family protein [Gammaproteobacteria bacterium]